jgi:hypothetical protein
MKSKVHQVNERNGFSPESNVEPYEDMSSKQLQISGEPLPEIVLELCDSCKWCAVCINKRGILESCPACSMELSMIPMTIEETCSIECDEKRGIVIHFDRKKPLR